MILPPPTSGPTQAPPGDARQRAYSAGAKVARHRMRVEAPEDADALERVQASDVVVIDGSYDHVGRVFDALELPYSRVGPTQLDRVRLRPEQLVVVNCPGQIDSRQVGRLAGFVHDGGSLFTTDWALRHVIEPGFPGLVAYNERPTADDVVRIQMRGHDNPFLQGVMTADDDPQWWLEASSYPIRVLAPDRVRVLIDSAELAAKYGEPAVVVAFDHGAGEVLHMISHYYLQRTELRSQRHAMSGTAYAAAKGYAPAPSEAAAFAESSLGDVESAASSSRLLANVVASRKRKSS